MSWLQNVVIEQRAGTRKDFDAPASYPLKGVTYPTDYGYVQGTLAEDGDALDLFLGTGDIHGCIIVDRPDCDRETKMFYGCTPTEVVAIHVEFAPVLLDEKVLHEEDFLEVLESYKS
jgi:phage protein U